MASALYLSEGRFAAGAVDKDGFIKRLDVRERAARTHRLTGLAANKLHSLLVSLPAPAALGEKDGLTVTLRDGERVIASKTLHQGDADLYNALPREQSSTVANRFNCQPTHRTHYHRTRMA
jgi:hypothetical protein